MARELRPLDVVLTTIGSVALTVLVALWALFHPRNR